MAFKVEPVFCCFVVCVGFFCYCSLLPSASNLSTLVTKCLRKGKDFWNMVADSTLLWVFLPCTDNFIMARIVFTLYQSKYFAFSICLIEILSIRQSLFIPQLEIRWTSLGRGVYKYTIRWLWDPLRKIPYIGAWGVPFARCKNSFFSWEADGINRLLHLSIVLNQGTCESLCPFSEDRLYILSRDKNMCRSLLV